ncbi:MAG: CheR family methyltransferase [Nitrospirota bacterium]
MDFSDFKSVIKNRCGLTFDGARAATLESAVLARMSARGLTSPADYLDCLSFDEDEFSSLVERVTVNETYFYREPEHLRLLTTRLVPGLLASRTPGERIRILSAGCSTGEEPYSIVIELMEAYGGSTKKLFSVTGADIDSGTIRTAKLACYNSHSFRQFPEGLKRKYFDPAGPGLFRLKSAVCGQVEFLLLNLLSPAYPDSLKNLDVIFYRNVSIYFEPKVQKEIFSKLADLLNDNGYLIVSSTETLSHNIGVMSLIEIDSLFLYQKRVYVDIGDRRKGPDRRPGSGAEATASLSAAPAMRSQTGYRPGPPAARPSEAALAPERRDPRLLFDEALALARAKSYRDAVNCIDTLIAQEPSFIKAYALKASVLINLKELDTAEEICLTCIALDQWCLEAFLLLGMIAKIRGSEEEALKRFKEALYIQSSCWLAHFYIADIYRQQGETERAYREYEIVVRLLGKGAIEDHGLTFFPLSFPVGQIMHSCKHNLAELRKRLR